MAAGDRKLWNMLYAQLALDFCCTPGEAGGSENTFTVYKPADGRRRFRTDDNCFLQAASVGGKVLMTGQEEILRRCRETFGDADGAWFMEMGNLRKLDGILHEYGYEIRMVHPFYIPGTDLTETERQAGPADMPEISLDDGSSCRIVWYRGEEIEQFRGDDRFPEAYSFCETAPDVIGTAAVQDGRILGMAGASADSPLMWQIGINVEPFARGKGIAAQLVTLLKEEILRQGALPYYGTAVSHIASQRVALRAGFVPAWTELVTWKIPSGDDSSARITP